MNLKNIILTLIPTFVHAHDTTAQQMISSPQAEALYGDTFALIEEMYPDLNLMIVTRDFIPGANDAYENHDLSFYDWCNYPEMTDAMGEALAARAAMDKALAVKIFDYSVGNNVFIPENLLIDTLRKDPTALSVIASQVVGAAFYDIAAAITLNHHFPSMEGTVGIITMPTESYDPVLDDALLSGLPVEYLSTNLTSQDHIVHTLGHEIGHLLNRDGAPNGIEDITFCSSVNVEASDLIVIGEAAHGDVEGAKFVQEAEKIGLTSGADVLNEIWGLRSVGTLMIPGNSYTVKSGEDMIYHLTNISFEPSQVGFKEAFDYSSLKGISVLPLFINNFADTLAGFAIAQQKLDMIKKVPGFVSQEDIDFYTSVPNDPSQVAIYSSHYAWIGNNERVYNGSPEYHYAAIRYMYENGIFDSISSSLRQEYSDALNDMVSDYLTGIDLVSPTIKEKIDYSSFYSQMEGIDVIDIGNTMIAWADAYTQDPNEYADSKGVSQTTDAIINYMMK